MINPKTKKRESRLLAITNINTGIISNANINMCGVI